MSVLTRVLLATLLPVLLYFSTVNLPLNDASWLGFWNNALWLATGLYFVIYLPVKGLGLKHWVLKVMAALLAISILTTAFQGAVRIRREQYQAQNAQP